MSKEQNFVSTEYLDCNHFDGDLYANTQLRERALNAAIAGAEISEGFEEYSRYSTPFTRTTLR